MVACTPQATATPVVLKETVQVEVEKQVEVTKMVEITAIPKTGPTNALGVTLPEDALPLDQQIYTIAMGKVGEQFGGAYGHEMESLYNRAYAMGLGSEALTSLDKEGKIIGAGCESWKQSDDGLYWDFKLRPELVFSDGKAITAADWVFTFQHSFSKGYDFGWFFGDILNANDVLAGTKPAEELGVEAVDDLTFRIKSPTPVPYIPALGLWAWLAPKQAYDQSGDNWSLDPKTYIASGPWKLAELNRGVQVTWELNETYKGVARPYITKIYERPAPSSLPAYMNGEIPEYSLGIDSPAGEVGIVNANPVLRSESHPQPAVVTWYIGFNTLGDYKELNDPKVRLALSKAIDKSTIIGEIGHGFADPAWGILPKGFPGNTYEALKAEDPNVFDVEGAKKLLADAGFPEGKGFPEFELWIRSPKPFMTSLCEAVQASWKANLGINVKLVPADHPTFTQAVFKDRKVPIYFVGYSYDFWDAATFMAVFRTGSRHPWGNTTFDDVYAKANAEIDQTKRLAGLAEAEKILVNDVGFIFLICPFGIKLFPCNLQGEFVSPNSLGYSNNTGSTYGNTSGMIGFYWSQSECRKSLQ